MHDEINKRSNTWAYANWAALKAGNQCSETGET